MGFHLFAKKIRSDKYCFVRDIVEISTHIAEITSIEVLKLMVQPIIDKYDLKDTFEDLSENSHYIIEDCYPSDVNLRLARAKDLLLIPTNVSLSDVDTQSLQLYIMKYVCKMGFSSSQIRQLIKECIYTDTNIGEDVREILIDQCYSIYCH